MYNVHCTVYDIHCVQVFSECTNLQNFQIHCVQNVHSSHPDNITKNVYFD